MSGSMKAALPIIREHGMNAIHRSAENGAGNAGLGKASDKNAVEDNDPNAKAVNKNNWKETSGAQKNCV